MGLPSVVRRARCRPSILFAERLHRPDMVQDLRPLVSGSLGFFARTLGKVPGLLAIAPSPFRPVSPRLTPATRPLGFLANLVEAMARLFGPLPGALAKHAGLFGDLTRALCDRSKL